MMLRNTFMLMSLLIVLVAGYRPPVIRHDGPSVASGTSTGIAIRQAINMALSALFRKVQQSPGDYVTAEAEYAVYKASAMYVPSSSSWIDTDSAPPSGTQLAQGVYSLLPPSAWIFQNGYCALRADSDCTTGIMTYKVTNFRQDLKKRSAPNFANSSFTTGIHYLPTNETVHAKISPRPSQSLAGAPLCKRDVDPTMKGCASMDTLIAGYKMKSGTRLYSSKGFFMEFQSDQNMCSTDPNGHKYWCMMSQNGLKDAVAPFSMRIEADGRIVFEDKKGLQTGEGVYRGPKDFQYRLTMQDDGNLVFYRGMDNNYPIWASHTGYAPYPGSVDKPCTGKFLI